MERLSDELLCQILDYLDPWTLLKTVQPVCRRFRRVALEAKLWHNFVSPTRNPQALKNPIYDHWAKVDWKNEWKWYIIFCTFNNCSRRNSSLRVRNVDDAVTVLTFALHQSDVVALIDDGTLRRWKESDDGWQEVSRIESTGGRETFRFREVYGSGATTQLGYNNAISIFENSIYFGVGKALQHLVWS
jgi:F-box-like